MKKGKIFIKRKSILIASLLVLTLIMTSCASKSANEATQASAPKENVYFDEVGIGGANYSVSVSRDSAAPAVAPQAEYDGEAKPGYTSATNTSTDLMAQRKIIMEGDVSLETKNFDEAITALDQLIEDFGGFAESRTIRGRSQNSRALRNAYYTIRVPADRFEAVMQDMGSIGTVLESNSKGTDITDQYVDYETRVRTLKVQEETLLELMEKATKLEDVITLEKRISEVRYEIESIENTLRNYDRLLAFSRINIHIQEVDDATESDPVARTLGDRISGAFSRSIKDFRRTVENVIVWFAGSWIAIIFYGAIIIIVVLLIKKARKKPADSNKAENSAKKPVIPTKIFVSSQENKNSGEENTKDK